MQAPQTYVGVVNKTPLGVCVPMFALPNNIF